MGHFTLAPPARWASWSTKLCDYENSLSLSLTRLTPGTAAEGPQYQGSASLHAARLVEPVADGERPVFLPSVALRVLTGLFGRAPRAAPPQRTAVADMLTSDQHSRHVAGQRAVFCERAQRGVRGGASDIAAPRNERPLCAGRDVPSVQSDFAACRVHVVGVLSASRNARETRHSRPRSGASSSSRHSAIISAGISESRLRRGRDVGVRVGVIASAELCATSSNSRPPKPSGFF